MLQALAALFRYNWSRALKLKSENVCLINNQLKLLLAYLVLNHVRYAAKIIDNFYESSLLIIS